MINSVLLEHIKHISESKSRFYKLRNMVSDWRMVIVVSIAALTLKAIAEQIVMAIR